MCDKHAPLATEVSQQGSRRRRVWELTQASHCPLVGVALPLNALRRLVERVTGGRLLHDDYDIHVGAVGECALRNPLSEALQKELEYLVTVKRPEIARILYEARLDKDIRENAPYDAAKHHQAEVEARIRYLERVLATARVVDPRSVETNGERATLGARVVLRDLTTGEELVYTLVGPTEANPLEWRLSVASPVGRAILDRRPGEEVEVEAPAGRVRFRIERIER